MDTRCLAEKLVNIDLSEILSDDDLNKSRIYYSTSKYEIEGDTNKSAIKILIDTCRTTWLHHENFMDIFQMPSYLENYAIDYL